MVTQGDENTGRRVVDAILQFWGYMDLSVARGKFHG